MYTWRVLICSYDVVGKSLKVFNASLVLAIVFPTKLIMCFTTHSLTHSLLSSRSLVLFLLSSSFLTLSMYFGWCVFAAVIHGKGKKAIHVQWQGIKNVVDDEIKPYRPRYLVVCCAAIESEVVGCFDEKKMSFCSSQYCLMPYDKKGVKTVFKCY